MSDIRIPRAPLDLTPDWLSSALGVPVAGVRVDKLDVFGIGGRPFRVQPAYTEPRGDAADVGCRTGAGGRRRETPAERARDLRERGWILRRPGRRRHPRGAALLVRRLRARGRPLRRPHGGSQRRLGWPGRPWSVALRGSCGGPDAGAPARPMVAAGQASRDGMAPRLGPTNAWDGSAPVGIPRRGRWPDTETTSTSVCMT
jgi:hypothetical protein